MAAHPALASALRTQVRVTGVTRDGLDKTQSLGRDRAPYRVRTVDAGGQVEDLLARAVIDASGTFSTSNPIGAGGLPAVGEDVSADLVTGPLPDVLGRDRARFAGKRVLVVGMGHSAAQTLLSLVELAGSAPATRIVWAIRGGSARRLFGGGAADELPARGLLGTELRAATESGAIELVTRASIERLEPVAGSARVRGRCRTGDLDLTVDVIVNATGFCPDLGIARELRLDLDPVVEAPRDLAPLIDPNLHSCGTVPAHGEAVLAHPDAGFYIVGMKSYGRAATFLLATGYEQVRSIAAALAGDRAGADAVQLDLPETGVCSSDLAVDADLERGLPVASGGAAPGEAGCCAAPSGDPVDAGARPSLLG